MFNLTVYKFREHINYSYVVNDIILLFVGNVITDLGIVFDRELNVHANLDKMCFKALKSLDFYKKNL